VRVDHEDAMLAHHKATVVHGQLAGKQAVTPGASSFVSSRAPEGLSGGGIKPSAAWVTTSGGANTAGIRGLNPA